MDGLCSNLRDLGLVENLLGNVDCQVRLLAESGYRALSNEPQVGFWLTALMTIYIAVLGLRLMYGLAPMRVGDFGLTALKIGIVLALATNWPAYQQVIFETLFHGPEQLASSLLAGMVPANAHAAAPLKMLQDGFDELQASAAFLGRNSSTLSSFSAGAPFTSTSLNIVSYVLLLSSLGVLLGAKIVLGLLLALGPVMAGLLLFESTRGIFEGWLQAILFFALVPLVSMLTLLVQLVLLDPYVRSLAEMRAAGQPDLALADMAVIVTLVSSGAALMAFGGVIFLARGLRLRWRGTAARTDAPAGAAMAAVGTPSRSAAPELSGSDNSAVRAVAMAIERQERHLRSEEVRRRVATNAAERAPGAAQSFFASAYRSVARPPLATSRTARDMR